MRYRNLAGYLRQRYGAPLRKICVDGGFTCPNRDGRCGVGGCIFCGERGAGEHLDPTKSIREQVERGLRATTGDCILYFQNFTNTYAPPEVLRARYDAALIDPRIRVFDVGTRPDCIDEAIADLLASYQDRYEVWVELGLQTANDDTADRIRRGYHRDAFERAMRLLAARGLRVIVHLIVGLPGEGEEQIRATADYLSGFDLFGLKIHSLYVMEGTALAGMFRRGQYSPPGKDEYVRAVCDLLSRTSPDTVIHRLTGDCPDGLLLAPEWSKNKNEVLAAIRERMEREDLVQGKFYRKKGL